MSKLTHAVVAGSIALAGAGVANAGEEKGFEVSGNVALTSDYRFRGLEQTDGGPAIQGGFDAELGGGIYLGTWASNVEFGDGASMEIDYYAGYAGEISDAVGYDVGYIYYDYPQNDQGSAASGKDSNADFAEWYVSFSVSGATLGAAYTDENTGTDAGASRYFYADYSIGLQSDMSLDLHYGHTESANNANGYEDVSVGLGKDVMGVNLSVAYVGTHKGNRPDGDDGFVFTISKSL